MTLASSIRENVMTPVSRLENMTILSSPYFTGEPMSGFVVPDPHETVVAEPLEGSKQARMAVLYRQVAHRVATLDRPVVYAGDCLCIIGVLAGLHQKRIHPTLLFFDAHGDFHTWETSASGFLGGMPLAMASGRGEQTIMEAAGLPPLDDDRLILVDGRDLDPGEDTAVAESGIVHTSVEDLMSVLPAEGPLYVHIDGDVVDPGEMPAMNYPAPGGPSLTAVSDVMRQLAATDRVVAFSVSSWNPELPGAAEAESAIRQIAQPFLRWSR